MPSHFPAHDIEVVFDGVWIQTIAMTVGDQVVGTVQYRLPTAVFQFGVSDLNLDEVVEFRKPYFGKIAKP